MKFDKYCKHQWLLILGKFGRSTGANSLSRMNDYTLTGRVFAYEKSCMAEFFPDMLEVAYDLLTPCNKGTLVGLCAG